MVDQREHNQDLIQKIDSEWQKVRQYTNRTEEPDREYHESLAHVGIEKQYIKSLAFRKMGEKTAVGNSLNSIRKDRSYDSN